MWLRSRRLAAGILWQNPSAARVAMWAYIIVALLIVLSIPAFGRKLGLSKTR
jgi:hypothetical protein